MLVSYLVYINYQRQQRRKTEQHLVGLADEARTRTQQLTHLQQAQDAPSQPKTEEAWLTVAELRNQTILTEADWERFRQLFERVYLGYLLRLRTTFPTLTPAQIQLICLNHMNLSTKEMAHMLGVSVNTIEKTRYRIRKKINLPEGADLGESFANF